MKAIKRIVEKFITAVVSVTTTFVMTFGAFVPSVALGATCVKQDPGTLIQANGTTAVYMVDGEGGKRYFPNGEVYFSWFSDFSSVVKIEPVCMDDYQSNGGMNYRPGSFLIKTDVSPSVFAIGIGNMKHKISDPAVAAALYGADWEKKLRVIPDAFDSNYSVGPALNESVPHDGMIIKTQSSSNSYFVLAGEAKLISGDMYNGMANVVSESVLNSLPMSDTSISESAIWTDPTQDGGVLIQNVAPKQAETTTPVETETETTTETETEVETETTTEIETETETTTEVETEVKAGEQTVNGVVYTDANYTGPFPAPEGIVLTGYVGKDTYTSPTGAGPYQYRVQTDWKRPLACADTSRVRIGSKGITWENGWQAGYNAGQAQFNSLVPTYNNTPTGSGAGNALYNEGYKVGYDHGWNDQTSVSTEYVCPNSSDLSKSEIEAAYDADGWSIFTDEDMPGLTLHIPQDAGVANTRNGIQVPGMTVRVQGNSDEEGPHTAELNTSLPMVNVDYIDFSVDTVGAEELALGPEGVLQATYDVVKQKDSNALCATSDASITTNTFGSNTVVSLDFFSACDVDGSSAVDVAWIPRHYSIIVGSNNSWLTMFISNNNDIGNDDKSGYDLDAYVNADFMTQFYTKLQFN